MGSTTLFHVCSECARKSPYRPLREPGTIVEGAAGRPGPVRTYENAWLSCQACGASDARPGYLRVCATCSRFLLLDHCEETWPPPAYHCPRNIKAARARGEL